MKKYVGTLVSAAISLVLILDCVKLFPRVDWSPSASSSSGIGVYLLGGLLEVNDMVPYCDTPMYFAGICVIALVGIVITTILFLTAKRNAE